MTQIDNIPHPAQKIVFYKFKNTIRFVIYFIILNFITYSVMFMRKKITLAHENLKDYKIIKINL